MAMTLDFSCLESRQKWKVDEAEDDLLSAEHGSVTPSSFVYPNVHDVSYLYTLASVSRDHSLQLSDFKTFVSLTSCNRLSLKS